MHLAPHFEAAFGHAPQLTVRAPGRINLIGEHTDYNGGFVLPAAIDKAIYLAISARKDDECHLVAHDLQQTYITPLYAPEKSVDHRWADYLVGVLQEILRLTGAHLRGVNVLFASDLPIGAGLSSSAAIENAMGFAVNELFSLGLSRLDLVGVSHRAENNYVGMNCGVMDMFASMMGQAGTFMHLDCRDLRFEYVPFEAPELGLLLCDTTVKHALVTSEYNTRRAECEEGVAALRHFDGRIGQLRDVRSDFLETHREALRPVVYRRCRHVIDEIARVDAACAALRSGDMARVGALMLEAHDSLSQLYEVSCPELDFLVATARETAGVLGARMMGGGFGGCTLQLIQLEHADRITQQLGSAFEAQFGRPMPSYPVQPAQGVGLYLA